MSKITFDEIMGVYPEHNRSVYEDLKRDCQRGCVLPFVGAGLSVFCGYQSWPDVLRKLTKFIFNEKVRAQVEEKIDEGELLQAAQEIWENYRHRMLNELRKIINYEKIQNCDLQKLTASAAWVLPYLFGGSLVMTTNFDRVLEEIYEKKGAKFGKIVTPYDTDLLTQIRQGNTHCLFKLHGDVGPGIHDVTKLVFTQEQYDRAYAAEGPLIKELSQWFQNKRLLFLGCSLAKDKTMEVLQSVSEKNSELDHYAIFACSPEQMEARICEMDELGISPIYYPDGKHDAVRVILERLLEEIDGDAYQELCLQTGQNEMEDKSKHRFMYYSDYIEFTGREEELKRLDEFCGSSKQISWWAVTGPGGMGKSRLVHEFIKRKKSAGWAARWLNHEEYDNLTQLDLPVDRCIVVADDVQAHLQVIGNWIETVSARQRSEKLRIILLEREGEDLSSAKWAEMMQADCPYDTTVPDICYCSEFLQLLPLSDEELKTIMTNFAAASGKPLTDGDHADRLLQTLRTIDPHLQRPVYALAIVDAWCNGNDPARWDKDQVLEALVNREMKFHYDRLRETSPKGLSKTMRSEFERLLARSCLSGFLPLEHVDESDYPKLSRWAENRSMDFVELLRQMGVVHKGRVRVSKRRKSGQVEQAGVVVRHIEAVVLDCPDLVKEYLVLKQAFGKEQWDLLFPENWANLSKQVFFLRRVLIDYPEKLAENARFWEKFFAGAPQSGPAAWAYSNLLFGVTAQLPERQELISRAVERLAELNGQFNESVEVAAEYGKGLVNQMRDESLEHYTQNVQKLELLREHFKNNRALVHIWLKGLNLLIFKQPLEERICSVNRIEDYYTQFMDDEEITLEYAKGLLLLTAEQPQEDCQKTVQQLKGLHERFSKHEEIAACYAEGVFNYSVEQVWEDRRDSIHELKTLCERFRDNGAIAFTYARGLVNLTTGQVHDENVRNVQELENLYGQNQTNMEIAIEYGKGLFNLTIGQRVEECLQSVSKIKSLYEQFQGCDEFVYQYAGGMVNLALIQLTEADVQETLKQAHELLKKYPNHKEIQICYAQTKFNLTLKQEDNTLGRTVAELREYLLKYPDIIPAFQAALDQYLEKHPEHTDRYQPLRV